MSDEQSALGDFYDPTEEFTTDGMNQYQKGRRVKDPMSTDEWPGDWHTMKTSATRLPSWTNGEKVIRAKSDRTGWQAFVHRGGSETWEARTAGRLHAKLVDYMERNP